MMLQSDGFDELEFLLLRLVEIDQQSSHFPMLEIGDENSSGFDSCWGPTSVDYAMKSFPDTAVLLVLLVRRLHRLVAMPSEGSRNCVERLRVLRDWQLMNMAAESSCWLH